MSIDNFIWVPGGTRNGADYRRYKSWSDMVAGESATVPGHQVFLAHQHPIDEQYFFEDSDDARWFWAEGYKACLFLEDGSETPMSCDRMALWIGGENFASRGYARNDSERPDAPVSLGVGGQRELSDSRGHKMSECAYGIYGHSSEGLVTVEEIGLNQEPAYGLSNREWHPRGLQSDKPAATIHDEEEF
jgi:hypothetical protein